MSVLVNYLFITALMNSHGHSALVSTKQLSYRLCFFWCDHCS